MTSRLHFLPTELLLLQAQLLSDQEVKRLCATDPVINRKLCQSSDYAQSRFDAEFTADKGWLKDNFLTDEKYYSIADDKIPASAIDYQSALREARLLTKGTTVIEIACRYNFDRYLYKLLDGTKDINNIIVGHDMNKSALITTRRNIITATARHCANYNRLAIFKYVIGLINQVEPTMRLADVLAKLSPASSDVQDFYLVCRKDIIELFNNHANGSDIRMCFDQNFYNYITSELFTWSADIVKSFDVAVTLFNDDIDKFLILVSDNESRVNYIIGNDRLNMFLQIPAGLDRDFAELFPLARAASASKILDYYLTLPTYQDVFKNNSRISDYSHYLNSYYTTRQLKYFFPVLVLKFILASNPSRDWDLATADSQSWSGGINLNLSIRPFMIMGDDKFKSNYRTMIRLYFHKVHYILVTLFIHNLLQRPLINIGGMQIVYTNMVMGLITELLQPDLVIDPTYRKYLALVFSNIYMVTRGESLGPQEQNSWAPITRNYGYRNPKDVVRYHQRSSGRYVIYAEIASGLAYCYFLYVKYYYLVNQVPQQAFEVLSEREDLSTNPPQIWLYVLNDDISLVAAPRQTRQGEGSFVKTGIQDYQWLEQYL